MMATIKGARSAASARTLLEFALEQGLSVAAVLDGTGLCRADLDSAGSELRADQKLRLFDNVVRQLPAESAPGLQLGRRYTIGMFGMLGFALLSCSTMRTALQFGLKYRELALSFVDVRLTEDGYVYVLRLDAGHLPQSIQRFAIDHELAVMWTVLAALGGMPPRALRAQLGYQVADPTAYEELLGARPLIGAAATVIELASIDMCRPLPQANAAAVRMCESHIRRQIEDRRAHAGISGRVLRRLSDHDFGAHCQRDIARELHTSPRSLRRHLAAEGSSFRDLVELARRERTERLLLAGALPICAIAQRNGYATASALTHAFKRWHGMTPREFRARNS